MLKTEKREQKLSESDGRNPLCVHCGDPCDKQPVQSSGNYFCCVGCLTVFDILSKNGLGNYYHIEKQPGNKPEYHKRTDRFTYLDEDSVRTSLLEFDDGKTARVTFSLPQIHCSSCVWLLENLHKLDNNIDNARIDLPHRTLSLLFDITELPLSGLASLLASIGYEPDINLSDLAKDKKKPDRSYRRIYSRLAVAGFCFGNVMMIGFPRYFGMEGTSEAGLGLLFDYLKILLALPVIIYAAQDFFQSAYNGLKNRIMNIDIPISLGIGILFVRSVYEILFFHQAGYIDSMTALVFLLLVGRLYQEKTFSSLKFDRDHLSYLPISTTKVDQGTEENIQLELIKKGDELLIYNHEIIPSDSTLLSMTAEIDYSFITGESHPVRINRGEKLFAGGRLMGQMVSIRVIREPSRSYLLKLWEETESASKGRAEIISLPDRISRYFTPGVIIIAILTGIYWIFNDISLAWNAATAVLIVACPCALALSSPFTLGTALRILGKSGIFLRHSSVIERMSSLNSLVFDKTGTITSVSNVDLSYHGDKLSDEETQMIYTLVSQSKHPLSVSLSNQLKHSSRFSLLNFHERPGSGLMGVINGKNVKAGSIDWIGLRVPGETCSEHLNRVYISIDEKKFGYYLISSGLRSNLKEIIAALDNRFKISLISGDTDRDYTLLSNVFTPQTEMLFKQSPSDKLKFIHNLLKSGEKVGMFGDGINDAGALRAATVGLTILEESTGFSPASDGIIRATNFDRLPEILAFTVDSMRIVKISLAISFIYNAAGLFFAVRGELSPVLAALLMPLSSLTIVMFTTITTNYLSRQRGLV